MSATTNLLPDTQTLTTNPNDLTSHFVTNGAANAQYAQPVLIPTSSGLILTAALPTMITQPMTQQQMPALHQFSTDQMLMQHIDGRSMNDKSSMAVSLDKRVNLQIPMPPLALSIPQTDGSLQSSYLSNSFHNSSAYGRTNLMPTVTMAPTQSTKVTYHIMPYLVQASQYF